MDFEVAKKQERIAGVWDHYFLILKPSALNQMPVPFFFSLSSSPSAWGDNDMFSSHNHTRESVRPIIHCACVVPLSVQPLWYDADLINAETR